MINQITLAGNLGRDPELRYAAKGNPVTTMGMAYDSPMKDREGNKKVCWIKIVCFRQLAETVARKFKKGDRIIVVGKLDPEDRMIDNVQIKNIQIIADAISLLDRKVRVEDHDVETRPVNTFGAASIIDRSMVSPVRNFN